MGPLPVKKPRGRPKGSKKVTTVSGQMVRVNGLYSLIGERSWLSFLEALLKGQAGRFLLV